STRGDAPRARGRDAPRRPRPHGSRWHRGAAWGGVSRAADHARAGLRGCSAASGRTRTPRPRGAAARRCKGVSSRRPESIRSSPAGPWPHPRRNPIFGPDGSDSMTGSSAERRPPRRFAWRPRARMVYLLLAVFAFVGLAPLGTVAWKLIATNREALK